MDLNRYQNIIKTDLLSFLENWGQTLDVHQAWQSYWQSKGIKHSRNYQDAIAGVPNVCVKVPTGGGKTFVACNALEWIYNQIPVDTGKLVVWFVPSLAIMEQTLKNLRDPVHPYRVCLNGLFHGRLNIVDKAMALAGTDFKPSDIQANLTILVASYDSFRSANKDGRKVYQENGSLADFGVDSSDLIADADESSLAIAIRSLRPVVVIDESHNAKSDLSLDMLRILAPRFILELTATPKPQSNVISIIDPFFLKEAEMVKLPVIVHNSPQVEKVVASAIDLRRKLEEMAVAEQAHGQAYLRPIVLFQAEPKTSAGKEEQESYAKIKERLCGFGIPADQIAIKTATINELKGIDLLSPQCPIRFIITINALKEGWDCPFAYILASLANKSSPVDVEQIIGRILRQPGAKYRATRDLNLSYVLTSSARFLDTLQNIIKGLNRSGYDDKDLRYKPEAATAKIVSQSQVDDPVNQQIAVPSDGENENELFTLSPSSDLETESDLSTIANLVENATAEYNYEPEKLSVGEKSYATTEPVFRIPVPEGYQRVRPEFLPLVKTLRLPQFFVKEDAGEIFGSEHLLSKEYLHKTIRLDAEDIKIDFERTSISMYAIDLQATGSGHTVESHKLDVEKTKHFIKLVSGMSRPDQLRELTGIIFQAVKRLDCISEKDLKAYIGRVINGQSGNAERLEDMLQNPFRYAVLIKEKIEQLLTDFARLSFDQLFLQNEISLKPKWAFDTTIHVPEIVRGLARSLYENEAAASNDLEMRLANELANMESITFWHRNAQRNPGFCLNGFINHYPDFIVLTKKGNTLLVEAKGGDRDNSDSKNKLYLGKEWAGLAGAQYKYLMVFDENPIDGAQTFNQAMESIARL